MWRVPPPEDDVAGKAYVLFLFCRFFRRRASSLEAIGARFDGGFFGSTLT
jgi:hypothetical protein